MKRSRVVTSMEGTALDHTAIDLLGHEIHHTHLKHLVTAFKEGKVRWDERMAERAAEGEPTFDYYPMDRSRECARCGCHLSFDWSGDENEIPTIGMQILPAHLWEEQHTPLQTVEGARCSVPEYIPTTVNFTCKSGRVALANDLRKHFPEADEDADRHRIEIGNHAGKTAYIKHYASRDQPTGKTSSI